MPSMPVGPTVARVPRVTVIAPKRLLLANQLGLATALAGDAAPQPNSEAEALNNYSDWSQRGEPALLIRATPYDPLTLPQIAAYPSRLLIVHPDDQLDPKRQLLATFRELFASTPLLVLEDAQQCQLLLSDQPSQATCWDEVQQLLTSPRRELSAGHLLIGRSRAFRQVLQAVDQLSEQPAPLLLQGEPGSGKAQLALAIHQRSQRRELSGWSIDCNQLSKEACRLALFGPAAEFATDATADSPQHAGLLNHPGVGTIIFHELAYLPPAVQLQLLNWLQQPRRDNLHRPHLVFTTSHDLGRLVADHRMRADLFFELSSHLIGLPPLRHRRGDVGLLIDHFTQCLAPALHICQRPSIRLSETQRELLDNYDWPGNVTQLRRLIVSHFLRPQKITTKGNQTLEPPPAADLSSADQLQDLLQELFPDSHSGLLEQSGQTATNDTPLSDAKTSDAEQAPGEPTLVPHDQFDAQPNGTTPRIWSLFIDKMVSDSSTNLYARAIEQFERGLFTEILNRTGGNVGEAARLLGITRVSLRKKLQHFSIEPSYFGKL